MNQRRALAHPQAPILVRGDSAFTPTLKRAFERSHEEDFDAYTHGFHSWPARLHRSIAAEIIDGLTPVIGSGPIVDPFMGGGTTIVEALIRGREATGIDLNPLAVRVATVRTRITTVAERNEFLLALEHVVEANLERIRLKEPALAKLPRDETRFYDGHVLRGLAGLFEEIEKIDADETRRSLKVLFSSIVVKFSRQRADTSDELVKKNIGRFTATEFFQEKGKELCKRWVEIARAVPEGAPVPRLFEGDARNLPKFFQQQTPRLVLTSPPYGGTYDYAQHHARRMPWLGLNDSKLQRHEIGSRRNLIESDGVQRWDQDVSEFLDAVSATIDGDSACVLVIGDGVAGGRLVPADDQLERLSQAAGLSVRAMASSRRPDWSARAPREEHLILLSKVTDDKPWAALPFRESRLRPRRDVEPEFVPTPPTRGTDRSRAWKEGDIERRPRDKRRSQPRDDAPPTRNDVDTAAPKRNDAAPKRAKPRRDRPTDGANRRARVKAESESKLSEDASTAATPVEGKPAEPTPEQSKLAADNATVDALETSKVLGPRKVGAKDSSPKKPPKRTGSKNAATKKKAKKKLEDGLVAKPVKKKQEKRSDKNKGAPKRVKERLKAAKDADVGSDSANDDTD